MHHIITNLHNKLKTLCQPDPKHYPNPSIREMERDRNHLNLYGFPLSFLGFLISAIFARFPFALIFYRTCCYLVGFTAFLIFCRSRPWIYHLLFHLATFVTQWISLEHIQESVYYHIGLLYITLTVGFVLGGNLWTSLVSVLSQIYILLTIFKEKLAICIYEEGPEVFACKFATRIIASTAILLAVNILLVKMLEKRTIELSKARIALESALEQQKTFIFSFSHELRNPINSLLGNLQLVLQGDENLSKKAKEMLNTAKVCGELLLHNINNVLDTGKNDIGKLEMNPTPTHLNELFQRTWAIYSELFRQKKLQGQLRIEEDLPPVVHVDSHKVNQMLLNLIGNSIKFTQKGSVSVVVKWLQLPEVSDECFEPIPYDDTDEGLFEKEENFRRMLDSIPELPEDDDGRQGDDSQCEHPPLQERPPQGVLKIIVKDTGSGMRPEALDKLFKKFSQVSEDVAQRNIGTGLGLFITKEICNAMGGDIRAYSKFGKGTTFEVCIPTTSVPMTNAQTKNSESILHHLATKHLKALVADDSPFNVNLICDYLAKFDASAALKANNGSEAVLKYKECKAANINIDVITLDVDMPVMDGRQACDKIREYEKENRLKPVPIILISGNYDKQQIGEYLDPTRGHKADCFLRKPVSFSEFHRTVYSLVVSNT